MTKELTGRHVLVITLAAFGVIIAVNLVMAFLAVGSFPGLEVKNSYVASQQFDRDRLAQENLGWTARASYDGAQLAIEIVDGQGADTDTIVASARAYVHSLNKLLVKRLRTAPAEFGVSAGSVA